MRHEKRILSWRFGAALALASGCATAVPVHEGRPPQALRTGAIRLEGGGGYSPVIGFATVKQAEQVPDTSLPLRFPLAWLGADAGIFPGAEFEAMAYLGAGTGSRLGLKYQWLGQDALHVLPGKLQASIAARYLRGSGVGDFTQTSSSGSTQVYLDDVSLTGAELSACLGWPVHPALTFYGGAEALKLWLNGGLRQGSQTAALVSERRSALGAGVFAGVAATPHTSLGGFELALEGTILMLPATYVDTAAVYTAVSLTVGIPFQVFGRNSAEKPSSPTSDPGAFPGDSGT